MGGTGSDERRDAAYRPSRCADAGQRSVRDLASGARPADSQGLAGRVQFVTHQVRGPFVSNTKAGRAPRLLPDTRADVEVVETTSDTSWALFQALQGQQERGFEKTRPSALAAGTSAARPAEDVTLDDVLVEIRRNNRVCPLPAIWQRLYAYLPNTGPHLFPVPASHAEWAQVPPLQKRARLRQHIEWAAGQGVLRQVYEALRKLPEDRWQHIGE